MISSVPKVEVEVQMQRPVFDGYRPHLRIGEGEYLGISFFDVAPSKTANLVRANAYLIYWPGVDYSPLKAGVQFQVLEGAKIVGHGTVVVGWDASA